jgi:hypothetical protein
LKVDPPHGDENSRAIRALNVRCAPDIGRSDLQEVVSARDASKIAARQAAISLFRT